MKILHNGKICEATPEEAAELERLAASIPPPDPTPDERMNEIEAALIELAAMMAGGGA